MAGGALGRYGTKFGQKFDSHTQANLLKFSDMYMRDSFARLICDELECPQKPIAGLVFFELSYNHHTN